MATYATIADARLIYGQDYVTVSSDNDGDRLADEATFERCLDEASARIDAYAEDYMTLPATAASAPRWWRLCTIDMAIYFASKLKGGGGTTEKRQRYDDAILIIEKHYPTPETTPTTPPSVEMEAVVSAGDRMFTRELMSDLL